MTVFASKYVWRSRTGLPIGLEAVLVTLNSLVMSNQTLWLQVKPGEEEKLKEFFKLNEYVAGTYDKTEGFGHLNKAILNKGSCNRLFYLALPPSVYEAVTLNIKAVCMAAK